MRIKKEREKKRERREKKTGKERRKREKGRKREKEKKRKREKGGRNNLLAYLSSIYLCLNYRRQKNWRFLKIEEREGEREEEREGGREGGRERKGGGKRGC